MTQTVELIVPPYGNAMKLIVCVSLCLLSALTGCATPGPPPRSRLEVAGNRLFVPATLKGHTVSALLDSAAEMTIVDDHLAKRLALSIDGSERAKGTGGTAEARFASDVDINVAGVELREQTIAVMDLADISSRLIGRPVELIVGREVFDAGRISIDIQERIIEVVPREATPVGTRFALVNERGIETFPVVVENNPPVRADFDLGNGSDVLVGRAYAASIGLISKGRIVGRDTGGGLGGAVTRDVVILKSLRIGNEVFENVRAAIDDTEHAGDVNVGNAIFRHFFITTDFPQRALWLQRRP